MVLTFKLADDVVSSLKNVLLARGFVEFISGHHSPNSWNFQWKTTRYSDIDSIGPEATSSGLDGGVANRQKINHFQKTTGICRKDTLARNLRRMLKTWGQIYSYAPETYILPRELKEFESTLEQQKNKQGQIVWICKPSSSSQGKNIFLITTISELQFDCSFVVQRYIANPMLIGGYKYDLRIYVLVTSFRPLCVYMYREGLARFSSQKYDPSDMSNLFSHLTNASINKASPDLLTEKEVIGSGCKWTMHRWFEYLESIGVNPYLVWERIKDIAILTLLPIVSEVPDNTRCFELFGFDVMLDETFKPWIIEVNASPAIAISGLQDTTVKIPLLNDLLDAIGFPLADSLSESTNTANFLPSNHPQFDPKAEARAIEQAREAWYAAQQAAADAQAGGEEMDGEEGESTVACSAPERNGVLNTANRGEKVQRVPRIVRMQSQQGREKLAQLEQKQQKKQAASSTSMGRRGRPAASPTGTRTVASSTLPSSNADTIIPLPASLRQPSQSPTRSPNGSPSRPSKIPIRRATLTKEDVAQMNAPISKGELKKPASASAAPSKVRRTGSIPMRSLAPSKTITDSSTVAASSSSSASTAAASMRIRSNVKSAPSAGPPSTGFVSTSQADELIGDFERIFPFDAATIEASDSIATSSVLRVKASAPLPVLFSNFSKATIAAVKARIRARDRIVADRAKDPSLPLRHAFTPLSLIPSPWTPEAIESAVQRAKDAAKAERARIGVPEPSSVGKQAELDREHRDESQLVEKAIQAESSSANNGSSSAER